MIKSDRYDILLNKPYKEKATKLGDSENNDGDDADFSYAEFLRNLERMCTNIGYLDSNYYVRRFQGQQNASDSATVTAMHELPDYQNDLTSPEKHASVAVSGGGSNLIAPSSHSSQTQLNTLAVAKKRQQDNESFQKRMKLIATAVMTARQDERELKRKEGDILKQQYNVRQSLREFDKNINKGLFDQEVIMSQEQKNYEQIEKQYAYEKSRRIRDRMQTSVGSHTDDKGKCRKTHLNLIKLSADRAAKIYELEMSHKEQETLMKDFEQKLKRKEMEQAKLSRELADINNSLNMESIKGRREEIKLDRDKGQREQNTQKEIRAHEEQLNEKLSQTGGGMKTAHLNKKMLDSKQIAQHYAVNITKREDARALQATRHQLALNRSNQRSLNKDEFYAQLMTRQKQFEEKLEDANIRKKKADHAENQARLQQRTAHETLFANKGALRAVDADRLKHVDALNHLEKTVAKDKDREYQIYQQMKRFEQERKQHEQKIRKLKAELHSNEVSHDRTMLELLRNNKREQNELLTQLKSELDQHESIKTQRDGKYNSLIELRNSLFDYEYELAAHNEGHRRLQSIGARRFRSYLKGKDTRPHEGVIARGGSGKRGRSDDSASVTRKASQADRVRLEEDNGEEKEIKTEAELAESLRREAQLDVALATPSDEEEKATQNRQKKSESCRETETEAVTTKKAADSFEHT